VLEGRYQIREQAGEGGMGLVFRATDLRHDRDVAIKVLRPEVASSVGAKRFLQEIRIAAQISHPHILPVHESGEGEGLLYYIMPFLEGETLAERMEREGPLDLGDVVQITKEVSQALSYAHDRGIVHRDLKPGNIALSAGIALVTDFGIARAMQATGSTKLTRTGVAIGTPSYMSPEQSLGDATLDSRSDIYSLACVVYEMLAGTPPYSGDVQMLLARHLRASVPDIRDVRPDLPEEVSQVLAIALAKKPDDGFPTVAEFADALESGETAPALIALRRRRLLSRSSKAVAGVIGVAALLYAGGVFLLGDRSASSSTEAPMVAVLLFEHLGPSDESYFTEGLTYEVSSRIGEIQGIGVIGTLSAKQFDLETSTLEVIGRELGVTHVVTGSIQTDRDPDGTELLRVIARLIRVSDGQEIWTRRFDVGLTPGQIFRLQGNIAQSVAEALNTTLLPEARELLATMPTNNLEAYDSFLRGNLYSGQVLVYPDQLEAITAYDRAVELDPSFGLAYARLARSQATFFSLFDRTPERGALATEALANAERLIPGQAEAGIAAGYVSIFVDGDRDEGLRQLEAVRTIKPNDADLIWAIGFVERGKGDYEAALTSFSEASILDPRSLLFLMETATTLWTTGRSEEALVYTDRTRSLSPEWIPGWLGRPTLLVYLGDIETARQDMSQYAIREGVLDELVPNLMGDPLYRPLWEAMLPEPYHQTLADLSLAETFVDTATFHYHKARLHEREADGAALAHWDSLAAVLDRRVGQPRRSRFDGVDRAAADVFRDRPDEARRRLAELVAEDLPAVDGFRGPFVQLDIIRLYVALGDTDEAMRLLRRLVSGPSPATSEFLAVDPAFDALRDHPDFAALIPDDR
jgi:serine/threonine-protein kinase